MVCYYGPMVKKKSISPFVNIISLPNKVIIFRKTNPQKFWIAIIIIGLLLLLLTKKNLVVAGLVNGQPITNFELQTRLNKQFRTQTLNQMITEKILEQEASKKGINITPDELNIKIKEIEEQYGGVETFNSILSQQGITREDFKNQTRLQLIVEKLFAEASSPSAEDIEKFMVDNKDLPEATDEAKFRVTAEAQVRQTNLAKVFNEKFQALKQASKIQIF